MARRGDGAPLACSLGLTIDAEAPLGEGGMREGPAAPPSPKTGLRMDSGLMQCRGGSPGFDDTSIGAGAFRMT